MIRALIMDVDGTLTDGMIYMGCHGEVMKAFSVKDGYALHDLAPRNHIVPIIMTGRKSDILVQRCIELGIDSFYQNVTDKLGKLKELAEKLNIPPEEMAYIGDDVNDLACMEACGVVGCPADAADEVKRIADYVSQYCGGKGAVRDFLEWVILRNQMFSKKENSGDETVADT